MKTGSSTIFERSSTIFVKILVFSVNEMEDTGKVLKREMT